MFCRSRRPEIEHKISSVTIFQDINVMGCMNQVWEFAEAQQRWQMIAELRESDEKPESVHHVSWAPNVGR